MGWGMKLKAGCLGVSSRSFSCKSSPRVRSSLSPSSSVRVPGWPKKPWTQLKHEDLTALQRGIRKALDEKPVDESPNESRFSDAVKGNIAVCSEIFEKIGNASNQNVKSHDGTSAELRHVFASVLQGVGNMHWMGVGLVMLAFCIDRWSKVQSNKTDCWDVFEKLDCLATQTFDLIDSLNEEKIERVIDLISKYVSECLQQIRASRAKRIIYATTKEAKLRRLDKEINHVFSDLNLSATIRGLAPMSSTTFTDEHDGMVGLPQRVDDIVRCLEEGPSATKEVRSIVFCGMLGVGTSTLGEVVSARLAKTRFEGRTSCRVLMKQLSGLGDVEFPKIQSQIIETLSKEKRAFADYKDGQKGLTRCFKKLKKPVQIFIDDVANEEQLRYLLPDNMGRDLPNGSRLLVATFSERVCDFIKRDIKGFESCQLYEVRELESEEARELFCRKAFGKPEVPEEFNDSELSKKIDELLEICGGLPLALELVGKYVGSSKRGTDVKKYGKDVISRLGHAVTTLSAGDPLGGTKTDRLATMKFAYDQLGSPLQSDFLDISSIHVGRSWKEAEFLFGKNVLTLKEFSLLKKEKIVHGDGNHTVLAMHSLLVALGQKQGHVDHDGVRIVARNQDTVPDCPQDTAGLRRLELLHLDHCTVNPMEHFEEAGKLRHLELYGMEFKNRCSRFPSKLQSFHFRCPRSRLPFPLTQMNNLLVLKLSSNPLVDEDLRTFKTPANLKMLKLTDSKTLEVIQKGHNSSLEQLTLYNCPKLRNIGRLSPSLNKLFIKGSPHVEDLSGIGDLHALEELSLIDCGLKTNFRLPSNLRSLDLRGTPHIKDLSGIGDLHALEELSLIDCGLKTDTFKLPSNLHSLDLSNNPRLVRLPHFLHCKLKTVTLRNCSSLVEVPHFILPFLRRTDVEGCSSLRHLPSRLKISPPQSPPSAGDFRWTRLKTSVRDHRFPVQRLRKSISDKLFRSKEDDDARESERWASNHFRSHSECGTRSSSVSTESCSLSSHRPAADRPIAT